MKFKNLEECKHFERDCLEDAETYIPTSHIEVSWHGGDFQVYSVKRRGGVRTDRNDVLVYCLESDGGSGGYVKFSSDYDITFHVLGIIETL